MSDVVPFIPTVDATGELINPRTGMVVTPESSDEDVIDLLVYLREGRDRLAELDGEISQWLRSRADARGKWTLLGGRASMPSPKPEKTWNKVRLAEILGALHDEGVISTAELEACAPLVVEVRIQEVTKLRSRMLPAVVERIDAAVVEVPKTSRAVKVRASR